MASSNGMVEQMNLDKEAKARGEDVPLLESMWGDKMDDSMPEMTSLQRKTIAKLDDHFNKHQKEVEEQEACHGLSKPVGAFRVTMPVNRSAAAKAKAK